MTRREDIVFQFLFTILLDCIAIITLIQTLLLNGEEGQRSVGASCLPHIAIWLFLLHRDGWKWHMIVCRCAIVVVCFLDLSMLLYWTVEYTECTKDSTGCLYSESSLLFLMVSHFIFISTVVSYILILLSRLSSPQTLL